MSHDGRAAEPSILNIHCPCHNVCNLTPIRQLGFYNKRSIISGNDKSTRLHCRSFIDKSGFWEQQKWTCRFLTLFREMMSRYAIFAR